MVLALSLAFMLQSGVSSDTTSDTTKTLAVIPTLPTDSTSAANVTRAASDTIRQRPRPIEYSEWYARRLEIHKIGSYLMLPTIGAEYVVGNQLLHGNESGAMKGTHVAVATGIAAIFTVNTGTGLWNLWDSRKDPAGRTRRIMHSVLMLAGDAGFAWTGLIGGDANHSNDNARRHRNVALGSMAVSTVGTVMMWLWKD